MEDRKLFPSWDESKECAGEGDMGMGKDPTPRLLPTHTPTQQRVKGNQRGDESPNDAVKNEA